MPNDYSHKTYNLPTPSRCVRRGAALFAKPEHSPQDTNPDGMEICGQKPAFQSRLLYPPEMRFLQKTD